MTKDLSTMHHAIKGILVELKELETADAEDVLIIRNNPEFNRFLSNAGQEIKKEDQINWTLKCKQENDNVNFKVLLKGSFVGTISLYDIDENGSAEFGRYIVTHPIAAIESELLLMQYGFEVLGLSEIVCKTVKKNSKVWQQHARLHFETYGSDIDHRIHEERVLQRMTADQYRATDFEPIKNIIRSLSR
jgi:RimJ/RimL family protein N-acetyltransferase